MSAELIKDVEILLTKVELFNDIIDGLRGARKSRLRLPGGKRWKNINKNAVETELLETGRFFFAYRRHASGLAVYIFTKSFYSIIDGRGKEHDVEPFDEMYETNLINGDAR